ncbi:MAG: 4Fe-4S binding protein [Syntrophobacteraceae bacterium]|nr:4Fe-4S binding protein [Syntrophobacteraceae bacterium]
MADHLSKKGYISDEELKLGSGVPSEQRRRRGPVAVIECIEAIPCNPCESSCKARAIFVGADITHPPELFEDKCIGCLSCVPICPGQAIFVVDESYSDQRASVTMPYEFSPLPEKNEVVTALDRSGQVLGDATVKAVRKTKKMDRTALVTIEAPREWSMKARAFRLKR